MMKRRRCANRLAGWSVLAGIVLACWLAGPAALADGPDAKAPAKPDVPASTGAGQTATSKPTSMPTSMPAVIDRGAASPKALLESMAKILGEEGNAEEWLGFQSPANRELVKTQLEMTSQLEAKAKKVAELVRAKFGKMEANMVKSMGVFHTGGELVLRYQISQIAKNGKVDWDKVKITENGDKAQAAIADIRATILLAKVDGKWYLGEGDGQETMAKDAEGMKEMIGTLMKVLDQLEQKVKSGQITKANFIQEYSKLINDSMAPSPK
jgi:hypothetical protein